MIVRVVLASTLLLAALRAADAAPSFVTARDAGGVLRKLSTDTATAVDVSEALVARYASTGAPMPEVLSVWTTFPFYGGPVATYALNQENLATGIGFDGVFGGDGTFASTLGPVKMILMHNDVTQLGKRAVYSGTTGDAAFARYLFLLELSHLWGPAARVAGPDPRALIGFTFHWSFFMDQGGSPAGGNRWRDNGDGTYTTLPLSPGDLAYGPLDLYLMGLADAASVPPVTLLENVVAPPTPLDPSQRRPFNATSFPNFGEPVTVTATRRQISIDEVIAATGPRTPAFGAAPRSLTLGVMLVVAEDASDADVAAAEALFEPIAAQLAPAFGEATGQRGALEPVAYAAPPDMAPGVDLGGGSDEGCSFAPRRAGPGGVALVLVALAVLALRRRAA